MAEMADEGVELKEDYSSIITGLKEGYELEMAKMERWASKERGSIETSYIEGGCRSEITREFELEELDTLRRLNAIRIAKHYFDRAQYQKSNVISRLESARYRKNLTDAALKFAKTANFPEHELTELKNVHRLAEEEEALLVPAKEAFEALEKEMYAHIRP